MITLTEDNVKAGLTICRVDRSQVNYILEECDADDLPLGFSKWYYCIAEIKAHLPVSDFPHWRIVSDPEAYDPYGSAVIPDAELWKIVTGIQAFLKDPDNKASKFKATQAAETLLGYSPSFIKEQE